MKVSRNQITELLAALTIMEGMLCEMLATVNMHRERFRAIIDLADERRE